MPEKSSVLITKGDSEKHFIRVLYDYALVYIVDKKKLDKDAKEFVSREALKLHKEYWELLSSKGES